MLKWEFYLLLNMKVTSNYAKSKSKPLLTSELIEQSKDFIFYRWTTADPHDIEWRKDTKKNQKGKERDMEKKTLFILHGCNQIFYFNLAFLLIEPLGSWWWNEESMVNFSLFNGNLFLSPLIH